MEALVLLLLGLGGIVGSIGSIWLIVLSFTRGGILWGLAGLFIPFALLVFAFTHLEDTKTALMVYGGGVLCALGGVGLSIAMGGFNQ